jgi:hypothetical protein
MKNSENLLDRRLRHYPPRIQAERFLKQVWGENPPEGFLTLFLKDTSGVTHTEYYQFFQLVEMVSRALLLNKTGEVWYSIGMQGKIAETGRGKADSIIALPGFWLDIDMIDEAHSQINLPHNVENCISLFDSLHVKPTVIVHTGHGLHAYFLFKNPLELPSPEDNAKAKILSRRFQVVFQSIAGKNGWKLDNTSDLSRVLRLPGTINRKREPVGVRVIDELTDYSRRYTVEELEAFVAEHEPKGVPKKPTQPVQVAQDTEGGNPFAPDLDMIIAGCGFLRHCRDDAATLPEPEWYAALSIVGRSRDGDRHAHDWSRSYPGYSYEETDRKLKQAMEQGGPRTCADIQEKFSPDVCETCLSRGAVNSPIALGRGRQPLPLKRAVASPCAFPLENLGPVLGPVAKATSEANGVPLALAGQSFLAAATLAVQGHADVEVDGRRSPVSNYFITVAGSGERKSSTDAEALAPHRMFEEDLLVSYSEAMLSYKYKMAAYGQAKSFALKKCRKEATREDIESVIKSIGEEPEEPPAPVVIVSDTTPAGLMRLFQNCRPSLGLFSDEGGQFVGGYAMLKEHQIETAANLSKFWDGKPITKSRGADGTVRIADRRLTMHLLLQPQVASMFVGNGALLDQGILSRTLIAYPASTIGMREYKRRNLRRVPAMKAYRERILAILGAPLSTKKNNPKELAPRAIKPSADAMELYRNFHNETEYNMREGGTLACIRGFANKSAEQAVRIAAVLTLVDDLEASIITIEKMQAGIELMRYYLHEALRIHGSFEHDPDLDLAERLLIWAQGQGERVALVDIYQKGPNAIRSKGSATRIVNILEDHGWFIPVPGGAVIDERRRQKVWLVVRDDG